MHQQIRMVIPASSPPDVLGPLELLADKGINLIGAGGGNVEDGGEFAISVDDDDLDAAKDALARYTFRVVGVKVCWLMPGAHGELAACIRDARKEDEFKGKRVR